MDWDKILEEIQEEKGGNVPIPVPARRGPVIMDHDEYVRELDPRE